MKDAKFKFEEKFIDFSRQNELFNIGDKVLVCLSGGADSVCLLYALILSKKLELDIYACHVNHKIRGEEAKRDENFCKALCERLGVKLYIGEFDVLKIAKDEKKSVELAAREVRYRFFEELSESLGFDKIATAHNKNDNSETLLMNFIRGSGLEGLCGIDVKRGKIVRPLICMEKSEILSYLEQNGAEFVTDSTNLSADYTRNKIRLELIEYIKEKLNPSFCKTAFQNSEIMRLENDFICSEAKKGEVSCIFEDENGEYISLSEFEGLHKAVRYRILRSFIKKDRGSILDIGYQTIERIDKLKKGKVTICNDFEAIASYGKLRFEKKTAEKTISYEYELEIGKKLEISECGCSIQAEIEEKGNFKKEKGLVYFDYDKLGAKRLIVRNRREGDIIAIEAGRKKLKDLFIDCKIDKRKREGMPIIVSGDEILWVCNLRRCSKFKVDDNTKRIIKISCAEGEKHENS